MSIVYLSAAYTQVPNKNELMRNVMRFAGRYMQKNPGFHVISPLFFHYGLDVNPEMGRDWHFWKDYSLSLLAKADILIVYAAPNTIPSTSLGVMEEVAFAHKLGIRVLFMSDEDLGVASDPKHPIDIDGMEIGDGVFAIGSATWNTEAREWRCLANAHGALCMVAVKLSRVEP